MFWIIENRNKKKKAKKNRIPAAKNGGKDHRPSFMAIQVELQIKHKRTNAAIGRYFLFTMIAIFVPNRKGFYDSVLPWGSMPLSVQLLPAMA
jgi:hypothetical protein